MASSYYFRTCKFCYASFSAETERAAESQRDSHEGVCPDNHNIMEDEED